MPPSSARRAQVEPLAALAAVVALGAGLALYGGALDAAVPTPESSVADATLERVLAGLRTGAVVVPGRVGAALDAPKGHRVRVTVRAANESYSAGPPAPPDAESRARAVPVRVGTGRAAPGRVHVEVWPWPGE